MLKCYLGMSINVSATVDGATEVITVAALEMADLEAVRACLEQVHLFLLKKWKTRVFWKNFISTLEM